MSRDDRPSFCRTRFLGSPRSARDLVRAYPRRLLGALGAVLLLTLGACWRRHRVLRPGSVVTGLGAPDPCIVVLFHSVLLPGVLDGRGAKIAILASQHGDGSLVGEIASWLGMTVISGSSSRGALQAFLEVERALRAGVIVAVTGDGPRGPRHALKPGLIAIAARTGTPVQPVCYAASHTWRFPSWDGFRVPAPGARIDIVHEPATHLDPALDRDAIALAARRIEDEMVARTRWMETRLGIPEAWHTRRLEPGEDPRPRPRKIRWIAPAPPP